MIDPENDARAAALAVLEHAYAPYSGFRVGAALVVDDGSVVSACNVENAAYPAGLCAERAALASAVAQGRRHFTLLVIATEADTVTPPCGMCRQMLAEFAPALPILSVTRTGLEQHWTLRDLLPHPFTPSSLHHP